MVDVDETGYRWAVIDVPQTITKSAVDRFGRQSLNFCVCVSQPETNEILRIVTPKWGRKFSGSLN